MFKILIFLGLLIISSGYALDISELCHGKSYGELVANPLDCSTYYICANKPMLKQCSHGLHFDENQKNCNWPNQSNCRYGSNVNPVPNEMTNEIISVESSTKIPTQSTLNAFGAFSIITGKEIDPMIGYDDQKIQCIHYGVYFLPHPRQCDKYFLCAFGHLYQHQCGNGIRWSYLEKKCTINFGSKCYLGEKSTDLYQTISIYLQTAIFPEIMMNESKNISFSQHISTTKNDFEIVTMSSESHLDKTSNNPPIYKKPKCPTNETKKYITFPYDCRKYYICILGIPVLTSCPNGLYWNENKELCGLTKTSKCNI